MEVVTLPSFILFNVDNLMYKYRGEHSYEKLSEYIESEEWK